MSRSAGGREPGSAAGLLDQSAMQHLMGYRLTLAELASRRVFQRHIGTPFKLRPVEFTMLLLLLGNGSATPKQLALTLGIPMGVYSGLFPRHWFSRVLQAVSLIGISLPVFLLGILLILFFAVMLNALPVYPSRSACCALLSSIS